MLSDTILANVLHLAALIVGCVLLLRKVAEIDGYHALRVVVLTVIFSSPVIFFGVVYLDHQFNPPTFVCGYTEINY